MKKILILSYFFPPANFAGSYRIASWAQYMHRFGYYPIIMTRQWNGNQTNAMDYVIDNETVITKYDHYEVHYIKVENNLREKLVNRFPVLYQLTKPLVFLELLLKGTFWSFHPSSYLYEYTRKYLAVNSDISWLIVTGNPFDLFKAGYELSREFGIKWIADYRDGWTSWEKLRQGVFFSIVRWIDRLHEKKWLRNATFFTTVNDELVEGISALIGKKGYKIMNGYNPDDYKNNNASTTVVLQNDALKLVYNGTLYRTQNLDVFFDGVRTYLQDNPSGKVQILFPGVLNDPSQHERIRLVAKKDLLPYILFTHRLPKADIIALQKACDIVLFFTHEGNLKGTFPSKMFEYFGIGKPILVCPNDQGSVEHLINLTQTGYVADNVRDVADFMKKVNDADYKFDPSIPETEKYTREKQCQKLAALLDQYTHDKSSQI